MLVEWIPPTVHSELGLEMLTSELTVPNLLVEMFGGSCQRHTTVLDIGHRDLIRPVFEEFQVEPLLPGPETVASFEHREQVAVVSNHPDKFAFQIVENLVERSPWNEMSTNHERIITGSFGFSQ